MPKVNYNVVKKPQQPKNENKIICLKCGESKQSEFYASQNESHEYFQKVPYCKSCIDKFFMNYFMIYNDNQKSMYYLCRKLDLPFSLGAFEGARKHSEQTGWKIHQSYFKQINSLGNINNHGACFDESSSSIEIAHNDFNSIKDSDFEITDDMKKFWGSNFEPGEYEYLCSKLNEYLDSYECETPAMEELLKQAAFESLEIKNKREKREDASKQLKNLQDILGSANIKPNQESGANATEQATFGLLIKKWENEEPIPEPDEEWKDVDGIGRYIRIWFLGHLCKMLGIVNEFSKEYEEEMAKLRVNMPTDNSISDELEEGE